MSKKDDYKEKSFFHYVEVSMKNKKSCLSFNNQIKLFTKFLLNGVELN